MASLVVEAVCHLVANDHANGAIVESVVGVHVKERFLQDAGREADLVGRGVIVGVDGLRIHVPVFAVNGLASLMVEVPLVPEQAAGLHVVIIRLCRVYNESRYVSPFVWITDLHIERVELVERRLLGVLAHPRLLLYALGEREL